MNQTAFEQVVVIGYGVVTKEVLQIVCDFAPQYGYTCAYIEHEVHPFNGAQKVANAEGISQAVIEDRQQLTTHFETLLSRKTLIISASNNYLFPKSIVESDNATIINFHNALLPNLPGRNAPSWAIFEGKEKTGITWHYVTEGVDAGDIIIQKTCAITEDTKAYELVAQQMKLAAEAFGECYEDVLKQQAKGSRQEVPAYRRLYKSYEVPGEAQFSLEDSPTDIYRLLRSIDYGKNGIFPAARFDKGGETMQVTRYKKVLAEAVEDKADRMYLPLGSEHFLMLKYKPLDAAE